MLRNFDQENDLYWSQEAANYLVKQDHNVKLISLLNKEINLYDLFNSQVKFSVKDNFNGWTHQSHCHFPDHLDHSPSFYYHPKENRFNCFGCHRGGGPVQFYALSKQISNYQAVQDLLKNKNIKTEDILNNFLDEENKQINKLLFDYSNQIRKFLQQYPENDLAIQYVQNLNWNLDLYLSMQIPKQKLAYSNIAFIVSKLLEILKSFTL